MPDVKVSSPMRTTWPSNLEDIKREKIIKDEALVEKAYKGEDLDYDGIGLDGYIDAETLIDQ